MPSPSGILWVETIDASNDNGGFQHLFEAYWKVQRMWPCNYILMLDAHDGTNICTHTYNYTLKCIFPDHKRCEIMVEWQVGGQNEKDESKTTNDWSWN